MKNIANCAPVEFLVQTNKIRKHVQKWLDLTKILEIRKHQPEIPDDADDAKKLELKRAQAKENLNEMLDAMLETHPQETAELLGLMCFVEPEKLNEHKMTEFFGAFNEIINCKEVIDFFISLTKLANLNTSGSAKA